MEPRDVIFCYIMPAFSTLIAMIVFWVMHNVAKESGREKGVIAYDYLFGFSMLATLIPFVNMLTAPLGVLALLWIPIFVYRRTQAGKFEKSMKVFKRIK